MLGGSWVAKSGERSPLVWVISIFTLLITLHYITTHEPLNPKPHRSLKGTPRETTMNLQFGFLRGIGSPDTGFQGLGLGGRGCMGPIGCIGFIRFRV